MKKQNITRKIYKELLYVSIIGLLIFVINFLIIFIEIIEAEECAYNFSSLMFSECSHAGNFTLITTIIFVVIFATIVVGMILCKLSDIAE